MGQYCQRCGSDDVRMVRYLGSEFVLCKSCGYDERESVDIYTEEKTSQKAKKDFSPYKTGGPFRAKK